jgi:hypothetical protein
MFSVISFIFYATLEPAAPFWSTLNAFLSFGISSFLPVPDCMK